MSNVNHPKMVTFEVHNISSAESKTATVYVGAAKKRISFDPRYHNAEHVMNDCQFRAVEKMYGKGKVFLPDNSNTYGRGQIWESSPRGGYARVTGAVYISSNW